MVTLTALIDNGKCYELIRQHRWPEGVCCPRCSSMQIIKNGKDDTQPERQRYVCKSCQYHFDDLSDSVFAGRHQPLRVWVGCLYLMGLNLSNAQIAHELDVSQNDVYKMTCDLRQAVVEKKPEVELSGKVEFDEVYVTAGHKGQPEAVKKKGVKVGDANSKGFGGGGHSKRRNHQYLG
jgi:transposase-like protein